MNWDGPRDSLRAIPLHPGLSMLIQPILGPWSRGLGRRPPGLAFAVWLVPTPEHPETVANKSRIGMKVRQGERFSHC